MRDRYFRRRQEARARHRAIRFLKLRGLEPTERQIHLYQQHRKPCSCWACSGNKREEHKWERRQVKHELRKDVEDDIVCNKKCYSW